MGYSIEDAIGELILNFIDILDTYRVLYIVGIISAVVFTVLLLILVTPEKRRPSLGPFFRMAADWFNLKGLFIPSLLKLCYIIASLLILIIGIVTFFFSFSLIGGASFGFAMLFALIDVVVVFYMLIKARIDYETIGLNIHIAKHVTKLDDKVRDENKGQEAEQLYPTFTQFKAQAGFGAGQNYGGYNGQNYGGFNQGYNGQNYGGYNQGYPGGNSGYQPNFVICPTCGTRYDKNQGVCPNCHR